MGQEVSNYSEIYSKKSEKVMEVIKFNKTQL